MNRYEILENNVVVNTIIADDAFMANNYLPDTYRVVPEPPHEGPPTPPDTSWYIDIGPFFDRFGSAKMDVLTSSDIGVQAIIKDAQIRKWIDLSRADVIAAVAYIASKVPTITPAIHDAIFSVPVNSSENMVLRKLYFGA